jgi:hypothetical protein
MNSNQIRSAQWRWWGIVLEVLPIHLFTAGLLACSVLLISPLVLAPCLGFSEARFTDFGRLTAWDGRWYAQIAEEGYSYDPLQQSNVAFFPAYPALAAAVMRLSNFSAEVSLLLVSNVALLAAMVLFDAYARERAQLGAPPRTSLLSAPDGTTAFNTNSSSPRARTFSLLALALFPTTFYFRMGLTEALFLLLAILALFGLERRWSH